jgi:hypothetical protein
VLVDGLRIDIPAGRRRDAHELRCIGSALRGGATIAVNGGAPILEQSFALQ